mgnify:FL=1|jgi:dihydroneopterin aldolase|tara:strand:- start:1499 stop:1870 length:372 start_codon:yes stop_codon:yes gene_type:complete
MDLKSYSLQLNKVVLYAYHGCLPEENRLGQRFVIDLCAKIALPVAIDSDEINHLISYADVYEVLKVAFTENTFQTLESCASNIASAVFEAFQGVVVIDLKISKPSVPVDCACESFGISVSFTR